MKIVLYGMPCAGKTTFLKTVDNIKIINGSEELNRDGKFKELSSFEQSLRRSKLIEQLKQEKDTFIIDGHYCFFKQTQDYEYVMTKDDALFYDVFLYLYEKPEIISERLKKSYKNISYKNDFESVKEWQDKEIKELRKICHQTNKDFYIIDDVSYLKEFINDLIAGKVKSNIVIAKEIVNNMSPISKNIILFDGDKTIVKEDTSRLFFDYKTHIFDNNFYSGFQFWMQQKEMEGFVVDYERFKTIEYNKEIEKLLNQYKENSYIISSGHSGIWQKIGKDFSVKTFAGPHINADVKYFVVKFLKENGYKVSALGDSFNDYFMLKSSDCGMLVVNGKVSRSLNNVDLDCLHPIYTGNHVILNSVDVNDKELEKLINITKSNSGISGNELAKAHIKLGEKIGVYLNLRYDETKTSIIELERSGHFLGDGIYFNFNGKYYTYNEKYDPVPEIETQNVVIVDGVINSGKTIFHLIELLKENPNVKNIIIATNVIQKDSLILFKDYPLYAIRSSENKFIGSKIKKQEGTKGPDTSDRLFNLL